jgi:hypothetical protein
MTNDGGCAGHDRMARSFVIEAAGEVIRHWSSEE